MPIDIGLGEVESSVIIILPTGARDLQNGTIRLVDGTVVDHAIPHIIVQMGRVPRETIAQVHNDAIATALVVKGYDPNRHVYRYSDNTVRLNDGTVIIDQGAPGSGVAPLHIGGGFKSDQSPRNPDGQPVQINGAAAMAAAGMPAQLGEAFTRLGLDPWTTTQATTGLARIGPTATEPSLLAQGLVRYTDGSVRNGAGVVVNVSGGPPMPSIAATPPNATWPGTVEASGTPAPVLKVLTLAPGDTPPKSPGNAPDATGTAAAPIGASIEAVVATTGMTVTAALTRKVAGIPLWILVAGGAVAFYMVTRK